ncbi:MAG: phosphoribosylformylglycinamidine synthase subunit PurQ [SAR202 cluster bacterium]|nr:phosphoribosylformylglycinamidine synthase I [Chloroflexota bacterium]MBI15388.1 phosphoribosylformylglycinamidine synthase I [Chloroflexota bacterium]MQG22769.1 phosphoribosylformylglycinamidine synthase subunit PurQ [SAR202 cluster bacterium]
MKFGVVVFPGTWSDVDCYTVIADVLNQDVDYVWHKETNISSYDCLILPGGFSYGDYLRCGSIAKFSPVMQELPNFIDSGKIVFGICNGFQILCEAGLLPGVLRRNDHLQFRCDWTNLKTEKSNSIFSSRIKEDKIIKIPISHGEGNFYADEITLKNIEANGQVAFRYCDSDGKVTSQGNPNGSLNNIAGVTNAKGNVLGMMPHPERCCDPLLGGIDGELIFGSIVDSFIEGDTF